MLRTYSSGIGYETVKALAQRGAKVYFTSRSRGKAQKTKEVLLSSYPQIDESNVEYLSLDLYNLTSIDAAARELRIQENKLDILSRLQAPQIP
jgi:NAD(P)-dependent dehydrogenase (short-subunit alcohol dehydrogenase family)